MARRVVSTSRVTHRMCKHLGRVFSVFTLSFFLMAGARASLNHEEEAMCFIKMVGMWG